MKRSFVNLVKPLIERSPKVAMTYRYLRDTWHLYDDPENTGLGFKFIGNTLMETGQYELEETCLATRMIDHADKVINIGANIGYYTCIGLCQGKHVMAFEPLEANLKYLLRNIKMNCWESNAEVLPLALSDSTSVVELYGGGPQASMVEGWGGDKKKYATLVPTSTLDTILDSRFRGEKCFCIVDIEGAEYKMLQGAKSFLCMNPMPAWMIEITISEHQPAGIRVNPNLLSTFQIFWDRNYEARTADSDIRLVHSEEVKAIADGSPDTFKTHNFLFVERGSINEWLCD
jgi:FkbM family methyltransferase